MGLALLVACGRALAADLPGEGGGLELTRRRAVEDEPLALEVALPAGMPLAGSEPARRVGDPGLSYRFTFRLLAPDRTIVREAVVEAPGPAAGWEGPTVVEPYSARYPDRLAVEVEAEVSGAGSAPVHLRREFPLARIEDRTPPFAASGGDEEAYPAFACRLVGPSDGGTVTTADSLVHPDGRIEGRSPLPAIRDDGATVEGAEAGFPGTLELEWSDPWDNLAPPFTGPERRSLSRFGVYLKPAWDLAGSHHLVTEAGSSPLQAERILVRDDDGACAIHLVDLTARLEAPAAGGSLGRGRVRIPLPYDRVGELEVGFYAEDLAWPAPNHAFAGRFRLRVVDDIAPVLVVSLARERGGVRSWQTCDAVNRRWTVAPRALDLPAAFGGPPMPELAALAVATQEPIPFHLLAYDNTRIPRDGIEVHLEGPPGAAGFGLRIPGNPARLTTWRVPGDGFDPGVVRLQGAELPRVFLAEPGEYRLVLAVADIHGNRRELVVPLSASARDFERIQVGAEGRRQPAGPAPAPRDGTPP